MISETTLRERLPEGYDKEKLSVMDMGNFIQVLYRNEVYGYYMKEEKQWKQKGTGK
jgi:hypothetical protein